MKEYRGAIAENLYGFNWLVYSGGDHQKALNHYCNFYKIIPWESSSQNANANFFGHTSLKSFGLWFKRKRPKGDLVAHEVFHAIIVLAEKLDLKITADNEEVFAYYQQMLFREITKILK